jgi:asparagine synthase (glutamine-hydrolysing)
MSPERAHVAWNGTFDDEEKHRLMRSTLPDSLGALLRGGPDDPLLFDQKYYLPDDILAKVDRMSMAHSVEVRPPFLDHRVIEFAASIPSTCKIHGSRRKIVLRQLMKGRLPESIPGRKKIGLDIPAHQWLRGPLRPLLEDTLAAGMRDYGDLFRASEIRRCLDDHLGRRANLGYELWGLMILFLWMKRWQIQTSAADSTARIALGASIS